MRLLICLCLLIIAVCSAHAQPISDSVYEREGLERLAGLLNLKLSDLAFRDDYTDKDSFRLAIVADLMRQPYGMVGHTEKFRDISRDGKLESILEYTFSNLAKEKTLRPIRPSRRVFDSQLYKATNLYYKSTELNRLLMKAKVYLYDLFPSAFDSSFSQLSKEQRDFLLNEFKSALLEDTADASKSVDAIDSIQQMEEGYSRQFAEFGLRIRKDYLLAVGVEAAIDLHNEAELLNEWIQSKNMSAESILSDTAVIPSQATGVEYLGRQSRWKIGGVGSDFYGDEYDFIFDFGGDDRYDLTYDPQSPHGTIIIDLSGNDIYNARSDFVMGSGCMSVGLLFDMGGDDVYNGANFSCGSGYFGMGLLCDEGGSDKYYGDTHTQGAGTFGLGLLVDRGGADGYYGCLYAQGFGMTEGFGAVVDYSGNDNYFAGGKYQDILRYDNHYISLSQGFATGIIPYLSGGIGAIIDYGGNDNYVSDIFGQGASFWWSLGLICDCEGNDQYISYQYAQGSAAHMSLGFLLDETGDDFYRGKGLMQGCGHDYSCGMILDRSGNDIYQAFDLSQGAGSANGFGIQIDDRGDDAYYVMRKNNTQGYGNPRRDFGSIGLFIDLYGKDRYDGNGFENGYWKTGSKWGGGMDIEFIRPDTSVTSE